VVFASQQGGGDGAGGPLNAIAEAAVKTQQEGGVRAALRGIVSQPGQSKPLVVTGHEVYADSGVARGIVTATDPKSGEPVKVEMVQDGTEVYMRSSSFGTLPDGKEWMGVDYSLGDDLETPVPAGGDALGELALLEKATGGVEKVGTEKVRGVSTTRYRGRISVAENAKRLRELGGEETAAFIEKEGSPLQIEAWIDAKGLVRQMRIVQTKAGEKGEDPTTTDMRIELYDFGIEPKIEVPESSEVFDTTSLVQEQLQDSGDE
ncbi:MAG: hypothetical protein ACTHNY_05255, partial [Solirubrobacterales bacterium]